MTLSDGFLTPRLGGDGFDRDVIFDQALVGHFRAPGPAKQEGRIVSEGSDTTRATARGITTLQVHLMIVIGHSTLQAMAFHNFPLYFCSTLTTEYPSS
jgi:hypothetical protein